MMARSLCLPVHNNNSEQMAKTARTAKTRNLRIHTRTQTTRTRAHTHAALSLCLRLCLHHKHNNNNNHIPLLVWLANVAKVQNNSTDKTNNKTNTGRVKTVKVIEGYGFIVWEHDKDIFFHFKQVLLVNCVACCLFGCLTTTRARTGAWQHRPDPWR